MERGRLEDVVTDGIIRDHFGYKETEEGEQGRPVEECPQSGDLGVESMLPGGPWRRKAAT